MTRNREIELQLEQLAASDFKAHAGKILLVRTVVGYNERDDSVDILCDPPARMRVRATCCDDDLRHWCGDWLDPYWDVDLIEPHPALTDIRSTWVFGPSYSIDGKMEPSDWTVENTGIIQRVKDLLRRNQ